MPNSPIASPRHYLPIDNTAVAGPGASGPSLSGKALLQKACAYVFEPDLDNFTPNRAFASEEALKRSTLAKFMDNPSFRVLGIQTENALKASGLLNQPGQPCLMSDITINKCLKDWGFTSPVNNPEQIDFSLYDLYLYGLPNLARAVAVVRELGTQTTAVDALAQGEIRQELRNLFNYGLTQCIPGVIQNIETAWKEISNCVSPPDLKGELNRRAAQAATAVLTEHVNLRFSNDQYFEGNQIHMVRALTNALAGKYGLIRVDDKYAVEYYAEEVLASSGTRLNSDLDKATAPEVLLRNLACDLMNQMRQRMHAEGTDDPNRNAGLVNGMAEKLRRQYVQCSPYTIGNVDPELAIPTQLSNSFAPLAIALLRQAHRQGLVKIQETQVEIPLPGLPGLNLLRVGNLVCSSEKTGELGWSDALVPLTLDALLPASDWLKNQLKMPDDTIDEHCLAEKNLGLAALMEACQNSKGGIWASVWESGGREMTAYQAKVFLDIMSVQTPELAKFVGRGEINSYSLGMMLLTVANMNERLFNQIPTDNMQKWLNDLAPRLTRDARHVDLKETLGKQMCPYQFTKCMPLALAAVRLGVQVNYPQLSSYFAVGDSAKMAVHGKQWIEPMLNLARPDQKVPLAEAMVRNTLFELASKRDDGQIAILDELVQKGACVFTNQESSWEHLLNAGKAEGLPAENLNKLLNCVAMRASKLWPPQALSLLFNAIEHDKVAPETVQACLASPSLNLVCETQGTVPGLEQAHKDYTSTVTALLNQRWSESLKLGFQVIGTFKGAGFPQIGDALKGALNAAFESLCFDVIEFASQSKLIPKDFVEQLLEKVCLSANLVDVDATRMAGCLLQDQFARWDSGHKWEKTWSRAITAVHLDKPQLATLLLNRLVGPDNMNKLDEHGYAELHYCAKNDDHKLIRAMVAAGADINIKASAIHNGKTPLHYAIRDKKERARKALVDLKADTNVQDDWGRKPGESGKLSAMLRRMR